MNILFQNYYSWKLLSWESSSNSLCKMQKRLFKSVYVLDRNKSLQLQKLILNSNCARLLAIREVTQLSVDKKIPGVDGKTSLTFLERFELNESLKVNWNNWNPQSLRKVLIIKEKFSPANVKIPTISDRAWQCLVNFALEPAHEAVFSPYNYGFRLTYSVLEVQNFFFLNLCSQSNGYQKRILKFNLLNIFRSFNHNYLMEKILAPRSVKLGLFKLLKRGFELGYPVDMIYSRSLKTLLSNIILDGIENIHTSIRFGYFLIYILKPKDNELKIINEFNSHLLSSGLFLDDIEVKIFNYSNTGFDFLDWHFRLANCKEFLSVPTYENYQKFLLRVKRIVNNSNYGSLVKTNKLCSIIKDWRVYHKYANLDTLRYNLFFIKKRAFKAFNSESKQDFYSTKRLLDKCFYVLTDLDKKVLDPKFMVSSCYGHMTFWFGTKSLDNNTACSSYFCIHCGMNVF
uniref:group II intron reverse transcriptase/maturase mat1 n=1 Tax=Euglena undulata TaxID=1685799 RepID=UPI0023AA81F0|nr:group II intron reverse transcriptase/maturase mat1 [Euglena undulata]WCH63462.1 group II intron reverse transcriptase/maturase mat1 [Euglena undulata]